MKNSLIKWQVFGHDAAKNLLEQQLGGRNFAHAYLFSGPSGIGKKTLAEEFAGHILDGLIPPNSAVSNHPDFIFHDLTDQSSIESVRELLQRLAVKPFVGEFKVAVIDNFDRASLAVANALLKTLEEPSPSTIIILISASRNILPTIVSRCQIINFNRLSEKALQNYSQKNGFAATAQILTLSAGAPGRLLSLINQPEATAELLAQIERLEQLDSQSVAERIIEIGQLAELDTEQLRELLSFWLEQRRANLRLNPQSFPVISRLIEAVNLLNTNINKKLILQRLLLNI